MTTSQAPSSCESKKLCDSCGFNKSDGREIPKATQNCADCDEYHCSKCSEYHAKLKATRHHTNINIEGSSKFNRKVLDAETLRRHMELQRSKLIEIIDSEFGFLDHLLSKNVIQYSEFKLIRAAETTDKKNERLLDYIFNNDKHTNFMTALLQPYHSHVANWITGNGDYRKEFGLDWPLLDELEVLTKNHSYLVETIDPCEVVGKLYSEEAISKCHRNFIESKTNDDERNRALLDIIRRSSRKTYEKLIQFLRESNQSHISEILETSGVIVAVHAMLESDNLDEAETQIVKEMTATIRRKTTSTEQIKRILKELELNIIAVKRGGSIVLYTGCCKREEFNYLCQVGENENMKGTLEKLFLSYAPKQTIRVRDVKVFEEDLVKARNTFAESTKEFNRCSVVIANSKATIRMSLNRPEAVTALEPLPSKFQTGAEAAAATATAAAYRNAVFVCGLGNEYKDIWKLEETSSKWNKCASLIQGRKYHSVAFVDHVLYICGGWFDDNGKALDDVETYNTHDDKCSKVGKLSYAVHSSGNCVPVKTSLYICGGLVVYWKEVSDVQVYDTKLNTCTLLTNQMPRACTWLSGELWENSVILLGKDGCFIYDIDTETWKVRDKIKYGNDYSGVIVNEDKLFVIGCGDKKDNVRWIPIVNILKDELIEWKHYAKLPNSVCEYAFAV